MRVVSRRIFSKNTEGRYASLRDRKESVLVQHQEDAWIPMDERHEGRESISGDELNRFGLWHDINQDDIVDAGELDIITEYRHPETYALVNGENQWLLNQYDRPVES